MDVMVYMHAITTCRWATPLSTFKGPSAWDEKQLQLRWAQGLCRPPSTVCRQACTCWGAMVSFSRSYHGHAFSDLGMYAARALRLWPCRSQDIQ